jgi:GNAT superfamily N-acetyltransferase
MIKSITFAALDKKTLADFEALLGPRGGCGGCWCMTWRLPKAEYEANKGEGNRKAIHDLINANEPLGILAYYEGIPAGWCAIAPREKYLRLQRARALKPVDDVPVWSVSCFFIAKEFRRKGLSVQLLKEAARYAKALGAKIIEAYPLEPKDKNFPDVFAWTGIYSSFKKAGFKEVKRHTPSRPIMRLIMA